MVAVGSCEEWDGRWLELAETSGTDATGAKGQQVAGCSDQGDWNLDKDQDQDQKQDQDQATNDNHYSVL
ncbi:hypothetical protein CTA1_2786 [Colletotrichum tanaceti]|uniref:Uncharacterized protein n=1 Tax=Colletotrichum tanaceti TaxID=1306861 RepID=A0A4U6X0A2_9PEZI|nr:hypothetical protein CTA1_2786 [Colletotrichum tanaceti]